MSETETIPPPLKRPLNSGWKQARPALMGNLFVFSTFCMDFNLYVNRDLFCKPDSWEYDSQVLFPPPPL